ncbi:MAG: CoA-disulfide reductase [Candidatus Marinimicrobia bacterium]|jgi:NADPH-dependent 2,4-dienoyl-CoA reductase/sulfur reductase-like enzyme|nr:CoA-disulfide reductase [Candidatus Neomarinimicrobiota bacterium]MBT3632643.1 CoA-disulfide reductase [Candidatus Neomarinimicrobiota bacterium]MBT3823795.1 CoA-disulfide reductase [Candidatus Neomarinimicrobiota bacterium]MBT4130777.1 CoA-disulfide reductase [Candidatus Neomarinimicrobiota bacterium]MBT4294766.1 CoA-disulfide reductase [Candidatus Neomarinimicrobiota bacterium]
MPKKYVIIGGDAAGMSAASKIRRMQPDSELVVFEKGQHISFAACGIPYWISDVIEDGSKLQVLTPEIAREKRGIDVRIGHEVTQIDATSNTIAVNNLETGEKIHEAYDVLLIATGARAVVPPIPGVGHDGVFTLRSLADGQRIKNYIAEHEIKHATIIGGGYIGLEMAEAYKHINIDVTMVEMLDQIAPTFDKDILEKVTAHVVEQGVDLQLETRVDAIDKSEQGLQVQTSAGQIQTDMVIVSTGVRPNSELARDAGIALGNSGAITINDHMQTSIPNIYSAGDCAEHRHLVLNEDIWIPLAPSANKGGRVAGENMVGTATRFPGILGTAVVKVFDYTVAQTGLTEKQAREAAIFKDIESTTISAGSRAHYYPGSTPVTIKLVADGTTKRLLGAQMIGKSDVAKRLDVLATALTAGMTLEDIGMLDLTYAPPVAPVYDPIHVAANVANK